MPRPSCKYTKKTADKIVQRLAEGKSLKEICRVDDIPVAESTVRWWVVEDKEGFAAPYERARDIGLDVKADEIIEIADAADAGKINTKADKLRAHVQANRDRIRIDARKWYLAKLGRKKYGSHVHVEQEVELTVGELTDDQLQEGVVRLLRKAGVKLTDD